MSAILEFDHFLPYGYVPSQGSLPAMVVTLIGPTGEEDVLAIVDTGAAYSIFNGSRASALGIDLLRGPVVHLTSLGGPLDGRLHRIDVEIQGTRFGCEVLFSLGHIPRELIGRHSLFSQIRFGIRESLQRIYFHPRP